MMTTIMMMITMYSFIKIVIEKRQAGSMPNHWLRVRPKLGFDFQQEQQFGAFETQN
jgi:hypothetical protein